MTTTCTMILGDCLEVMPTLSQRIARLAVLDLPYGCSGCEWDKVLDLNIAERQIWRIMSADELVLTFANESFLYRLRHAWAQRYRYALIWNKNKGTNFYAAKMRPMVSHEFIGIWGAGNCFNPQMREGFLPNHRTVGTVSDEFYGKLLRKKGTQIQTGTTRMPLSVLDFQKDRAHRRRGKNANSDKAHSSQKPIALLDWLIRTYSNEGDVVLDPTAGSFTTCVSAASCGRSSVGIERNEGYFEVGVERVRKHIRDKLLDVKLEVRK